MAMVVIAYLVILLSGEVFIITLGPFKPWYCHTQVLLKHWTTAILVLMADCIVIVRSVLIFWLKSPSIVHDDFWNCFLTIWIIGFAGASPSEEVNEMVSIFSDNINRALDQIAPVRTFTIRSNHRFGLSENTQELMKKRDSTRKSIKDAGSQEKAVLLEKYKILRNNALILN